MQGPLHTMGEGLGAALLWQSKKNGTQSSVFFVKYTYINGEFASIIHNHHIVNFRDTLLV